MQIVNESDRDMTWWCYNSNDTVREFTLTGGTAISRQMAGGPHLTRRAMKLVSTTCNSRG